MDVEQFRAKTVLTITRAMLTVLDPDTVLQTLVDMTKELDLATAAAVWEYREDESCLGIRCSAGLSDSYVRYARAPIGTKAVGRAFARRDLVVVGDVDSDLSFGLSLERLRGEGVGALLGAPMVARERLLGILVVYFPRPVSPSEYDTDTIRTLANLAALAIDNARLYQGQVTARGELETLNRLLEEKSEVVSQSLKIHDWLIQTVLTRDGLDSVTGALARFARATVVLEDDRLNLLSVSHSGHTLAESRSRPATLGLSPFVHDQRVRHHLARIRSERRPQLLDCIEEIGLNRPRIVAPVLTGEKLLGYVSIVQVDHAFGELDFVLSEQGAVAIALEMTKQRAAFEVEQKARVSFLRSLLAGEWDGTGMISATVGGNGFDLRSLRAVLMVRLDESASEVPTEASANAQMADLSLGYTLVEQLVTAAYPKSVLVASQDDLVVLVGSDQEVTTEALSRLGEEMVLALGKRLSPSTVSVGIGGLCTHPKELRRSFTEAARALDVGSVLGREEAVLSFADLGVYGALLRDETMSDLRAIVQRHIAPIVEHDRRHQAGLIQTLAAYVRNDYRLDETARELFVHAKTVKYRLQRIEQLSGASLRSSEGLLNLQIALRLHQLTGLESDRPAHADKLAGGLRRPFAPSVSQQ